MWLEVSLLVSESGFSFLELSSHPLLCHGDTCKAVFSRAVIGCSLYQSVLHTSFQGCPSILDPGSMGCDCPQACSKQHVSIKSLLRSSRPTLPIIFGPGPLRMAF